MQLIQKIIFILFATALFGCEVNKKVDQLFSESNIKIECGAEKWEDDKFIDNSGDYKLSNSKGRSTEEKRSGEYSLKLVKDAPYGMTIVLDNIKPDDFFRITVWQKGDGHICASDDLPDGFYKANNTIIETDSLGWSKLSMEFYVPYNYKSSELKLLLCNFGDNPVYFDDLEILKERERTFSAYQDREVMNIFISDKNYQKLSLKRQEAFREGLLTTADEDWVNAIIFYKDQVLDTKVRLKGDRLDHLNGKKWSFRVKVKGDNSWNGMKTFSIQTPSARNFLHEWVFHKALEKEDILCTSYGFVPVNVNGESLGIYAWEEHFEKQLLESRNRREGPILKLSDDSYWINDKLRRQKELDYSVPNYDASVITPFKQNSIVGDSLSLNQFKLGRDLYHQYKYAKAKTTDIFDVEKAAKYYAMTDATNAYHTLHFFNQRFYYNPVLGKLEPIFFDSFADVGIFDYDGTDLIVEKAENTYLSVHLKLFADPKFEKYYFEYLKKYSDKAFWEKLYLQNKDQIDPLNSDLKKEYPSYNFDINTFYNIANEAAIAADAFLKINENKNIFDKFADRSANVITNYKGKADFELLPHLVKIYTKNSTTFQIENYSTDTISISGFSDIQQMVSEQIEKEIIVPPANSSRNFKAQIESKNEGNKFVFIQVRNKKISIPIIPWGAPNSELKHTDILNFEKIETLATKGITRFVNDTILISGKIQINENLILPDNKIVIVEKGSSIDLINQATLLSYSPLFVKGTKEEPVTFFSSDGTGKGVNVFQAKRRSEVNHAIFRGLSNLDFNGWITTGAVCFYESDVDFENVIFAENKLCDDALNIVRSDYLITNCTFERTFSDAFDSDFCTGTIDSTQFIAPGNDAIDFSGSSIFVQNCNVINAGDKNISCGEDSKISIRNCIFNGGNIGVASKDKSQVSISDSEISNVTYGMVAFCKKPEYGPATIIAENIVLKKYLFVHLIEEGSSLSFNNRKIFGQEKDLAKRFY